MSLRHKQYNYVTICICHQYIMHRQYQDKTLIKYLDISSIDKDLVIKTEMKITDKEK